MSKPIRTLVLEDRVTDAELMIRELRRAGFDPQWQRVETEAEFLAALDTPPELILSDYALPHFDGLRAAILLRERGLDIPFILISGTLGEEAAVEAMKLGATDYLLKDRITRLGIAVERALEEKRLRGAHQRAGEELRESEERLRLALEAAHLGTFDWDVPHNRIIWSRWHEELWGFQPGDFAGTYEAFASRVHPDDLPGINDEVARCIAARESFVREFRIVWPDGSVHWIASRGEFSFDDGGQPLRMRGAVKDITEHKQLEEQLRQSQKMEAIGQLAGGVAHDFNNILGVMMMQTELTAMIDGLPEEVRSGLNEIRLAAERAANLTRQLLLFSRRQVMQPRPLDLNESVTSLARMLQRILGEDIRLQLNLHPKPVVTYADAGMLDQVLMNLAINARDAMPGGGQLNLETAEKVLDEAQAQMIAGSIPGRFVRLKVSDTGCGIPPDNLSRIFEPFFTTKEPGKGTGLGLATVFGIVKQHNGWLQVRSEVGQGTTFEVFFPASETQTATAPALIGKSPSPGGSETILLVEDEQAVRTLTRIVLERYGYTVVEAADGVEALDVWAECEGRVALLLTDMVMPEGVNGQELAAKLQAEKPDLKVIICSGYSTELAGRELKLRPGQSFLQKPFPPDQLLEAVRELLDA